MRIDICTTRRLLLLLWSSLGHGRTMQRSIDYMTLWYFDHGLEYDATVMLVLFEWLSHGHTIRRNDYSSCFGLISWTYSFY